MENENNDLTRPPLSQAEVNKMIEENLALTREIHEMTHKIKSYVTFQKVMAVVWIFLIVAPIVWSIFYLPPILNNLLGQYSELLGGQVSVDQVIKNSGLNSDLLKQIDPKVLEKIKK